jgi:putative amino-acid transport system substrate-binding protein
MDRVSSAVTIQESSLPLQLAGEPFSEIQNALPFRDDEEGRALRDEVDAAITSLKESGDLRDISVKWLGIDVTGGAASEGEASATEPTDVESTAAETEATEAAPAE